MIRKIKNLYNAVRGNTPDQDEALQKYQEQNDAEEDSESESDSSEEDNSTSKYKTEEDYQTSSENESLGTLSKSSQVKRTSDESVIPDIGEYHKNLIAPPALREDKSKLEMGEKYVRTLFINGWPDSPNDAFLEEVISDSTSMNDISIHLHPYDNEKVVRELETKVRKAENRLESSGSLISDKKKQKDYQQTKAVFDQINDKGSKLYDVGFYITIRADTEKELENSTERIVKKIKTDPAYCTPEVPVATQLDALRTVNPALEDHLNQTNEMVAGAIGAMYPFSSTSYIEQGGIDYGIHAGNQSPVIIDRFGERQTGYNQLTFGTIGSGKSYGTKLEILRSYARYDDIKIIMLDPLNGFKEINKALGGEEIVVGGNRGLNPLEIHPPKENDPESDPYGLQKSRVMEFFEMYFNLRNKPLSEIKNGRGILGRAVETAYKNKGIDPKDPETFEKESPTVLDVKDVLIDMQENTEDYADTSEEHHLSHIKEAASEVSIAFEQFEEGSEYSNLAKQSEVDIRGEDVHYINLKQRESSDKTGLMMHVLLQEVYEEAKRHDGKTLFAIDEAHKLLQDTDSANYLENVVRHSRHADLGINFITQTIEEFFESKESRRIVQMCSIKKFQRVEDSLTDEMVETLGLTNKEQNYIRNAQAGDPELDYSESLVGVEGQYIPILIVASDAEDIMIRDPESVDNVEEINSDGG